MRGLRPRATKKRQPHPRRSRARPFLSALVLLVRPKTPCFDMTTLRPLPPLVCDADCANHNVTRSGVSCPRAGTTRCSSACRARWAHSRSSFGTVRSACRSSGPSRSRPSGSRTSSRTSEAEEEARSDKNDARFVRRSSGGRRSDSSDSRMRRRRRRRTTTTTARREMGGDANGAFSPAALDLEPPRACADKLTG